MKRAVMVLVGGMVLVALVCVLLRVAWAQNPLGGTWQITLEFTGGGQPSQTHTLVLQEDGHWSCSEWGMQGFWDRPRTYQMALSGERQVSEVVTQAFAITGAKISSDFNSIKGDFVLWRQPAWAQTNWATGEFKATRQ